MSKLIAVAAVLYFVMISAPALAQTACQQRCLTSCSGKGNMCANNCESRCARYGTARRGS
jgi:hypothetical protein